jgi:Fe-S cluster biogenesis protein NfuA
MADPYISEYLSRNSRPVPMTTLDRIEQTLDTLRPYIASHRGQVEVVDFDEGEGILLVRLGGTCHGCAASTVTLKQGIESRLREMVPEVKHVEAV